MIRIYLKSFPQIAKLSSIENGNLLSILLGGHATCGSLKGISVYNYLCAQHQAGGLGSGSTLVELSSGHSGVALATFGKEYGYSVEVLLPHSSKERFASKLLSLDAKIQYVTDDFVSAYKQVTLVAKNPIYYWVNQFENVGTPEQFQEFATLVSPFFSSLDIIIAPVGSGGTLRGLGKALKHYFPKVLLIAVESDPYDRIPGMRSFLDKPPFVDKYITQPKDIVLQVSRTQAQFSQDFLLKMGINGSLSTGATFNAAMSLSLSSQNIVIISPDGRWL